MATQWQIGDRIQDRWQIYKILEGGMGIVYIVYDHEWHEAFAAKTFQERLFASQQVRDRFIQEAHTWINLDIHQYIVRACFVEVIGGRPFIFLEYVTGGDLSRWIGTPRLTLERALRFAVQFCYGMEYALSKGVKAHRDIKPANVLLTEDGTLKITDFGLAKVFDEPSWPGEADEGATREGSRPFGWLRRRKKTAVPEAEKPVEGMRLRLTHTGMGAGTVEYMAPEQFEDVKRVDVRADVYSFGVMLYEMVSGQLPFGERPKVSQRELERRHRTQSPPSLRGQLPKEAERLEAVVQRCLRKKAGERYEDFGVLRRELVALYEGFTGKSAPVPVVGKPLNAIGWSNKGVSLGRLGRPDEALACYDRALAIDPQYAMAWNNKGAALGTLGRYDEEIACCDRALAIDPQYKDAWVGKGTALAELGQPAEALACYDRALAIDPQYKDAWYNKGVVLGALGRPQEALACFDRALAIDPQDAMAWHNKGVVLHNNFRRYREALECFQRAQRLGYAPAAQAIAACLQALGR